MTLKIVFHKDKILKTNVFYFDSDYKIKKICLTQIFMTVKIKIIFLNMVKRQNY